MMGGYFTLTLFVLVFHGVFGVEVKTVMEGDSVTLNPDVTKQQHEIMRWYFNGIRIAHINGGPDTSCLYDGEDGIFKDRLKVNAETGSLTITNIRSEHTGHYELEFIRSERTGTSESLNRNSKCDSTKIIRKPISADDHIIKSIRLIVTVSVMEGDSVTLNPDVTKQHHEIMRWYFNDIRIAHINGHPNTSCLYDGEDGIFRDRLKVNSETGSLNITNIRSEHTGRYELEFIRSESTGTSESLNRNSKCDSTKIISKPSTADDHIIKSIRLIVTAVPDSTQSPAVPDSDPSPDAPDSGLSPGAVAGIVVAVVAVVLLLFVSGVAGMIYHRRWTAKKAVEMKNNQRTDGENDSQDPLV